MRISDWSSDVCSSDLVVAIAHQPCAFTGREAAGIALLPLADKDFRSVLEIACRQRARYVVRRHQAEAEAVSGRPMLVGVALEVLPELVGERVFPDRKSTRLNSSH